MDMAGERRRRVWRRVVIVWALVVAVAGGLTLWMQDSTEPQGPYVWENTDPEETPDLPPCPTPEEGGAVLCAYAEVD
ncbi:hypothetical protein PV963_30890 [Streptomyces coeruleorubidus]|uniref:hypothetical protein n=1 Tax=Streptomyces coeruleorubidus TaxID=116188 RepID=UPI00237F381B|nr:hypothetical protein [Streptomyces coeruleorubidus]WDV54454.1 hypothetical protein PV963_30890 [Streptomyces coeruleorubidus]